MFERSYRPILKFVRANALSSQTSFYPSGIHAPTSVIERLRNRDSTRSEELPFSVTSFAVQPECTNRVSTDKVRDRVAQCHRVAGATDRVNRTNNRLHRLVAELTKTKTIAFRQRFSVRCLVGPEAAFLIAIVHARSRIEPTEVTNVCPAQQRPRSGQSNNARALPVPPKIKNGMTVPAMPHQSFRRSSEHQRPIR